MSVSVGGKIEIADVKKDLDKQIDGIFFNILTKNIPAVLKKHNIEDPKSYTLLLKNRGSTRRRQLDTIRPMYLKIGTGQPRFDFVVGEGSYQITAEIAVQAYNLAARRAPHRTGNYINNLTYFVINGAYSVQMSWFGLKNYPFKKGDMIAVTSAVAYASVIEAGFYKRYYATENLPGGILHKVAKDIFKKDGEKVAVSFRYLRLDGGTFPCIVLAPLGQFAPTFTAPGSHQRRQSGSMRRGRSRR